LSVCMGRRHHCGESGADDRNDPVAGLEHLLRDAAAASGGFTYFTVA
jgi:hypothetical protein